MDASVVALDISQRRGTSEANAQVQTLAETTIRGTTANIPGIRDDMQSLLIVTGGTGHAQIVPLHYDDDVTIGICLQGWKHWELLPPHALPPV